MVGLFRRRDSDGVPSNQERKKDMHKKSDRKGLALGAIFALVVSLFGPPPAAQAATDGSDIGIYPTEGTTFTGTVVSDFPIYAQLKQTSTFAGFTTSNQGDIVIKVEREFVFVLGFDFFSAIT